MDIKELQTTTAKITRPRPLLMAPLRRCGSHAIRLRLNLHPGFYAPYPLHIVDFMPLVPLYGDLTDDRNYFQLITDVVGLQAISMVKWPDVVFDPTDIFEALKNHPRSVHAVVGELLFEVGRRHNATVVMDKSLDSIHYADALTALWDDMLFLNVVRDPRAQVASMNRAIIHDFDSGLNAITWKNAHMAMDAVIQKWPERVLTVRYEDFLADQESVLRAICRFLGLDFLPSMLDVARSEEAQKISGMSALWESNCYPPIPANAVKFKQSLSMKEIEIIETVTGEWMDRYGYERMTAGKSPLTLDELTAARHVSEEKRRDAWINLSKNNYKDYVLRMARADYLHMVGERLQHRLAEPLKPRLPFPAVQRQPARAARGKPNARRALPALT